MRVCRRRFWVRLFPKSLGDLQRFDIQVVPPGHLVTGLMQLLMVITAERHGVLVDRHQGRAPSQAEAAKRGALSFLR